MIRHRQIKLRCDVSPTGQHAADNASYVDRYRLSAVCAWCRYPVERKRIHGGGYSHWSTPKRELLCEMCDREYKVWFAPNELWNAVMRQPDKHEWSFVCPTCFTLVADERGVKPVFCLSAE